MDKCLIFSNLELPRFRLQDMKIKPLIQLREMISKALSGQTNLSKTFQSFFIEAMELFLTIPNRINFLQMGRFGRSSEQRFRMNFRKKFDWISFNRTVVQEGYMSKCSYIMLQWLNEYFQHSGKGRTTENQKQSLCATRVIVAINSYICLDRNR